MINNLVELIPGVNYTLNMFMGGHNFRVLYILSGIWQSTGWGSIIYMAALSSVDPEAARGRDDRRRVPSAARSARGHSRHHPHDHRHAHPALRLRHGHWFRQGLPDAERHQPRGLRSHRDLQFYKAGLTSTANDAFSYATAIGLFNSGVNLFFVLLVNKIADKVNGSGLW